MKLRQTPYIIITCLLWASCVGQANENKPQKNTLKAEKQQNEATIIVGAAQTNAYLKLLKNKRVGVVANHTSMVKDNHLVDTLINLGVGVVKVFSPEHGFRGKADAGEKVSSDVDAKTGLPVVSLYGKNKKPSAQQIEDLDVILFDIQDVGARFYTYISTMHYVMEACAAQNKQFIVLDRPNPNGHYVDGPILEENFKSFVGMHPVPIVHGMTVGEYAQMINGEKWLKNELQCNLTVITSKNYTHNSFYKLPIKPSPNLPNMSSIYLYPSLCLFEGTPISVGRGTNHPFQIIGHPSIKLGSYSFTPKSMAGAKNPKLNGENCLGYYLGNASAEKVKEGRTINLDWLIAIYRDFPVKDKFFTKMFQLLSGTDQLQAQIEAGKTAQEIKSTWKVGVAQFKIVRKKYLLYEDFE